MVPGGVIHSFANGRITDASPLTKNRRETIDAEFNVKAIDFMKQAQKGGMPFYLGWNSPKMHLFTHFKFTHVKEGVAGKTGLGIDNEGMVEHDRRIGELRAQFKELGIEDNTIVMGATEKGSEAFTWPAGGTTMLRVEQNTLWEGGCGVRGGDCVLARGMSRRGLGRPSRPQVGFAESGAIGREAPVVPQLAESCGPARCLSAMANGV